MSLRRSQSVQMINIGFSATSGTFKKSWPLLSDVGFENVGFEAEDVGVGVDASLNGDNVDRKDDNDDDDVIII